MNPYSNNPNQPAPRHPNYRPADNPGEVPPRDQAAQPAPPFEDMNSPQTNQPYRQGRPQRPDPYYQPTGPVGGRPGRNAPHGRMPGGPRPQGFHQGGTRPGQPHQSGAMLVKVLEELGSFFSAFFSSTPAVALTKDLSTPAWSILLFFNILLYGLSTATLTVKMGITSLQQLAGILIDGNFGGPSWGTTFALGLLHQVIVLLLYFLGSWLFSGMGGEQRMDTLQYLKMVTYITPLHSLISLITIFTSLFAPHFTFELMFMNDHVLLFTFVYMFDNIYEKSASRRYWMYAALLLAVTLVKMILP